MGQYGNQPDFITKVVKSNYAGSDTIDETTFLDGSIIYVGDAGNGDLTFIPAGSVGTNGGFPTFADQGHTIVGVQAGSTLPFVVDYIKLTSGGAQKFLCGK
jgi:hypothetical protein